MLVRPGTIDDRDAAVELWRACEAARGRRPAAAAIAEVTEQVARGLLVVALDDELVGFALGDTAEELSVALLVVHPTRRREGIGGALADALADAGWARGYRSLAVWTRTPEFYEAIGFDRTGATDGDLVRLTAELEAPVREVPVASDGIRLGQLLKLAGVVDDGAMAREVIERGLVAVNGEVDTRRGRQVRVGDVVTYEGETLTVTPDA